MNKATKVLFSCFMLAFMLASTSWAQDVTKIRDARDLAEGTEVTIEGIITSPDYGFSNNQFFMQDSTAGMAVIIFGSESEGTNGDGNSPFASGDSIKITGTTGSFNGLVQIESDSTNYTILSSGNALPAPVSITEADVTADSEYQSMRVKISPVSLADGETWPADAQTSSGVNVDVVSGDSTFTLRIDRDESYYDGAPAPGEKFQLIGNLGAYNAGQIFPFFEGDIRDMFDITFTVNTSLVADTLMEDHVVQIRGAVNGAGGEYLGQTIDWNSGSDLVAENQGGDYWQLSFQLLEEDTLIYKVWTGYDLETGTNNGDGGWETISSNREFGASSDSTHLIYSDTDTPPFVSEADSITVFFRVNVGAQVQNDSFDPSTDKVGIRGADTFFANGWDATAFILEQDGVSGDNYFYSGSARIHKDSAAAVSDPVAYKFTLLPDGVDSDVTWEDGDNSTFTMPEADSTIHWKYFSNTPPTDAVIVDTELNFEVNVGILEGLGFFNSSIDTVFVRGTFNNWGTDNQMSFNSFSGTYEANSIPLTAAVDSEVKYKYYVKWDQRRDEEDSEFYLAGITHDGSGWEEPGVTGGADRIFAIENSESQPTRSEFYNGVEPEALLTESNVDGGSITVTFSYDMTPAESYTADPFDPAVDSVYLFVDTPFFALTNDIVVPGDGGENFVSQPKEDIERLRFKDEDEDGVYTLELTLNLPTLNHIGFRIAYGSALSADGELLANGGGFDAGRRHYQYIQPMFDSEDNVSWPSTYTFPTLEWKRDDLPWETPPDYRTATSNDEEGLTSPDEFKLSQNYPNPFNPTTNIAFKLGSASNVTLSVYNVLGQKVASLLTNRKMSAGSHIVGFDASQLSSGIYFYRIEAGSFVQQRSMTLIK